MVFVFESREKIEADRQIEQVDDRTERHVFTQRTTDIITDDDFIGFINRALTPYADYVVYYPWGNLAIGVLSVLTDAMANAAMWGNRNKPGSRIELTIEYGYLGSALFVEDEGEGFDYHSVIERMRAGDTYFRRRGGGTKKFNESHLHVAYHGRGNLISIATPHLALE